VSYLIQTCLMPEERYFPGNRGHHAKALNSPFRRELGLSADPTNER
jgi:hypothetical protein